MAVVQLKKKKSRAHQPGQENAFDTQVERYPAQNTALNMQTVVNKLGQQIR